MSLRPTWAEISLPRLRRNYALLRAAAPGVELMAVVKANAYGHNAALCAPALVESGARWLGVTCLDEGIAVRQACPDARVLLMSGIWQGEAEAAIEHGLTPVVWETAHLAWIEAEIEAAAAHLGIASFAVHVEIDSGMSRQGVRLDRIEAFAAALARTPHIHVEGVMTHFHSPEVLDDPATARQLENFDQALARLAAAGVTPSIVHAGNSATALTPAMTRAIAALGNKHGAAAMVRPGLSLYGYAPRFSGEGAAAENTELQPVLAWKTRVISLRTIEPGETAGYNATFQAEKPTRLALLPVGYADGLNRLLSNRGAVLIRGQRAPIAGRVSMDLTIVDVTDIDGVKLGDEAVILGEQRGERGWARITADELAAIEGTIPYEVLCAIGPRVPRRIAEDENGDA